MITFSQGRAQADRQEVVALRDALDEVHEVRISLLGSKSLPGTSPIFAKRATSGASAAEGAGKRQCKSRRRSNHPRLFRAALDAREGILNDIGLTPRKMSDTSVLNERITENRGCRVRRIIFGGQPISTTRSIGM